MMILDEKSAEFLAQIAYETHSGIRSNGEIYPESDAHQWKELPYGTRQHWFKIVDAVFFGIAELDAKETN